MGCRNSSHVIGKKRIVTEEDRHFDTSEEFDSKRNHNPHINNNGSINSSKSSSRMSQQTDSSGMINYQLNDKYLMIDLIHRDLTKCNFIEYS